MKTLENESDRQAVRRRMNGLRPDLARRWGKMSAHQMVCHLSDSFRAVMGRKPWNLEPPSLRGRVLKFLALYAPLRWPRGVPTRPEVDALLGGTPPAEFAADRVELERLFDSFVERPRAFEFEPHPMFGAMSERDWMRWGYLHMDHHFRQFGL